MNTPPHVDHFLTLARNVLFVAVSVILCVTAIHARPVRIPTPEELFEMSDAVVNGRVADVTLTSERGNLALGTNKPITIRIVEARIVALASSKGNVSGDFTLRFPVMDPDIPQVYVNGPMLPYPQKGERYRFYLKQKDSDFVTVLHDEFDSGYAVHRLSQNEEDDSAPLFKEEAQVLATKCFREYRPNPSITACEGSFNGSGWSFSFFTGPPLSFPSFSYDADITIDGSRSISQKTWVGRESPRNGTQLSRDDIGKSVRLTIEGDFVKGSFRPEASTITILYGTIDSINKTTVSGSFVSPAFELGTGPQIVTFPRKNIASIQHLLVSPNLK